MLFQILDIDYTLVNESPVVRIFGKDEKGETVCGFYEGYSPYFYALGDDLEDKLKGEPNVIGIEKVKRFLPIGYQTKMTDMFKIILQNPAKTPELRDKLFNQGYKVFEADIPFKYRFMSDHGLKGIDWISADSVNSINTATVSAAKVVKINRFEKKQSDQFVPFRIMAFDIECISEQGGGVPDAKKDPIIMMSVCLNEDYKGAREFVLSTRPGNGIRYYESEKDMLEGFAGIIMEYDPDILTGYNVNNFDIPYVLERMSKNNLHPAFGRCTKKVMANKIMNRYKINIAGRAVVDSFEIIKKDFSLKRYDLNTVATELLGEGKEDVRHSEIEKLWKGSREDLELLIKYALKDSRLALDLLLRLNLLDKYIALAKTSATLLQDILDSGETTRIENFLLREFNKEDYVIPCKPSPSEVVKREKARKVELKGGFVLEPEKGLHSSVLVLDFKSMYPSLIRTYNICPTTIAPDAAPNTVESPSGNSFVKDSLRRGIIPRILETLMNARSQVKKKLKTTKNESRARELNAEQWAYKIMANAFYGYFGYPRAKVYSLEIANSITSWGREIIHQTKDFIEKEFNYNVVYGDTDSVMVKVPFEEMEDLKTSGDSVSAKVNSILEGVMELEFEKAFKRFLPLTKKRYAAWSFELAPDGWRDKIETKGIETVRRDWCDLVSVTMNRIIEIILKENDINKAVAYFKEVADSVAKGTVPVEKLVITKTMTKRAEGYEGVQPHAELVKKMKKRDPADAPGVGDRIGYIIVKGMELLSKRSEDPTYVKEKGLEIDSKYYIENQLLPPLERIFSALGISKTELLGKGKQANLFTAINNGKPEPLDVIQSSQVTGFLCSKCGQHFEVVPYNGVCRCGGSLLFASKEGPARSIVVS